MPIFGPKPGRSRRNHPVLTDEEGTASIEFAIVAGLLLVLLLGMIAYGIQFASRLALAQAASEGARASVGGIDDTERTAFATAAARAVLERYGGLVDVDSTVITAAPVEGEITRFQVTVTHDLSRFGLSRFVPFVPVPSDLTSVSVTVTNGGI